MPGLSAARSSEFLQALTKQIRGKLLVIWDGLPAHRSRVVKDYVESLDGHLVLERLPAYARNSTPSSTSGAT